LHLICPRVDDRHRQPDRARAAAQVYGHRERGRSLRRADQRRIAHHLPTGLLGLGEPVRCGDRGVGRYGDGAGHLTLRVQLQWLVDRFRCRTRELDRMQHELGGAPLGYFHRNLDRASGNHAGLRRRGADE
jgi:hypothetical protein